MSLTRRQALTTLAASAAASTLTAVGPSPARAAVLTGQPAPDRPSASPSSVKGARNYVREALEAMAGGRPVAMASTRPYGCSVKY